MSRDTQWVRIECRFGALFSYRIPDFNSFYALASPLPSPSTLKLSLVSCMIEATGSVNAGRELFTAVRDAPVALMPAKRVASSRILTKRLKKAKQKEKGFTVSFGIREYLHCDGPLTIWIRVPPETVDQCLHAARHLRRLGTTDSLVSTIPTVVAQPDWSLCARKLDDMMDQPEMLRGRLALPLNDLTSKAELAHFAPVASKSGAGRALDRRMYLFPLTVEKQGANWLVWKRVPFENGEDR